jgi:hypothetical protein
MHTGFCIIAETSATYCTNLAIVCADSTHVYISYGVKGRLLKRKENEHFERRSLEELYHVV